MNWETNWENQQLARYEDSIRDWPYAAQCYNCRKEIDLRNAVEVEDACFCDLDCAHEYKEERAHDTYSTV